MRWRLATRGAGEATDVSAWYNENDPRMANVLEELILQGHIAPGVVDRRSIVDVRAEDLRGFTQCHFFAGIGVWPHALRRVGWPDDRPCWTGSCPCQPFSLAGNGAGFDDPRHLWPYWFRLIVECGPGRIFGEQVASAGQWLDLVAADLEARAYAFGAVDLAAAGFAGAHIRQRFMWVADAHDAEWWADHAPRHISDWSPAGRLEGYGDAAGCGDAGWVADTHAAGLSEFGSSGLFDGERVPLGHNSDGCGAVRGMGLTHGAESATHAGDLGEVLGLPAGQRSNERAPLSGGASAPGGLGVPPQERLHGRPGYEARQRPTELGLGDASQYDWLWCRDNRWRPVESGSFPLVTEAPARMGRLHGYGNAIDAEALTQFLDAYICAAEGRP